MAPIRRRYIHARRPFQVTSKPAFPNDEHFDIEDFIGSGRWGYVFKVNFRAGKYKGRRALKFVKEELQEGLDETVIQLNLKHPNILKCYGSFEVRGFKHIVMELCENYSMHDMLMSRGHLTHPEVRIHLIRILGGLKYLHKRGFIHRDLKPENLLLGTDMTLKIADFGLAVDLQSSCDRPPVRGTRRYIAPELLGKEKLYKQIADMYSVGVIISDMLPADCSTSALGDSATELATDLVEQLVIEASQRFQPDDILNHSFMSEGSYLERLCLSYRFVSPESPRHGSDQDKLLFQEYCRMADAGKDLQKETSGP